MKPGFFYLILIQFLLLVSSIGRATDNFNHPMIFSGVWVREARCRLVTIQAFTEIQGQTFFQQGVGWVIKSESGYKILTPSHVVAGAEVIFARCNNQISQLVLQSRTETKDLALLSPQKDISAWVFPLINLTNREKVISELDSSIKTEVDLYHPDHFKQPLAEHLYKQIYNFYVVPASSGVQIFKTFERDLVSGGVAHFEDKLNSLVAETLAIRPGFSGSPLFAQIPAEEIKNNLTSFMAPETYYQSYLLGMLTKVEVNGSRSLGVSILEILKILPQLLQSHDSSRDVYAEDLNQGLRLSYKLTFDGQSLVRSQELLVSRGSPEKIYSEICQNETAESSDWDKNPELNQKLIEALRKQKQSIKNKPKENIKIEIKVKEFRKLLPGLKSFEQKSSGGDYGEGGGGFKLSNSQLMAPANEGFPRGGQLTSYKRITSCVKTAVLDERGHSLDSLLVEGKIQKATNLSEAYDALAAKTKREEGWSHYYLRGFPENTTYYQDEKGQQFVYSRSEGLASKNEESSLGELRCLTPSNLYKIKLKQKNLSLDVVLGHPQRIQGQIVFDGTSGRCEIKLSEKNYNMANRWKHQIRSSQANLDITLGTEGRLLSIKVLNLAPECQKDEKELWMYEINFSDPEQIKKSFRRKSLLGIAAENSL